MEELISKLYRSESLPHDEIIYMLNNLDEQGRDQLYAYAHRKRLDKYAKKVYLRGLIEFSNVCKQNCLYCGIRVSNKNAQRYRLSLQQILDCCTEGYNLGFRTFVLQSGEDTWYTQQKLVVIVRNIKAQFPAAAITLSIGERDEDTYVKLFEAGAERFLMRHETASKRLYTAMHPTMSFVNRRLCLNTLQRIGYQIGAGFMVGLPGQTYEDLAEDLLYLKQLNPDMIGIGPFLPHQDTPLKFMKAGTLELSLTMIALARLFVPNALIPATTAMGTLHPMGRERALKAGANVVMPNLSPVAVRRKYALYDNKICTGEESAQCKGCLALRIEAAGFEVDMGRGDSLESILRKQLEE